jgi:hypothetical protein
MKSSRPPGIIIWLNRLYYDTQISTLNRNSIRRENCIHKGVGLGYLLIARSNEPLAATICDINLNGAIFSILNHLLEAFVDVNPKANTMTKAITPNQI